MFSTVNIIVLYQSLICHAIIRRPLKKVIKERWWRYWRIHEFENGGHMARAEHEPIMGVWWGPVGKAKG